ncbi:MAG TPA: hypothetical protein PK636_05660 [bacterium]|nr:hypothetical protein [bacterium]HPJ72151.1 hypothetical protein [bacterium]HPQ67100.1 hypothetical protein [bacterium]
MTLSGFWTAAVCLAAGAAPSPPPPVPAASPPPSPAATSAPVRSLFDSPAAAGEAREIKDGFSRYVPDENGDIDWEIKGSSAQFVTSNLITLQDLVARSFDQDIGPVSIRIASGDYNTDSKIATGRDQWIEIRRGTMVLTGRGVVWSIPLEEVRVLEDVRVLIKESGGAGMFPE